MMKTLRTGVHYIVTKASAYGSLKEGDEIYRNQYGDIVYERDGRLELIFFAKTAEALADIEWEIDPEWRKQRIAELREEIMLLEGE